MTQSPVGSCQLSEEQTARLGGAYKKLEATSKDMQATKDTFYVALRDRLTQAYPARTITVDGMTRPAIVVVENDQPSVTVRQHDAFYLEWGDAYVVRPAISTLMAMQCRLSYASAGSEPNGGLDRGRNLAELESELLAVCAPSVTRKYDYTSGNLEELGSNVFWNQPAFGVAKAAANCVAGQASMTVYFYPEVNQQ